MDDSPADLLERGHERIIIRQQRARAVISDELSLPAWPHLYQPRILLQEIRAVKVATAIEEHFHAALEPVDQVPSELVGCEQAHTAGQLFQFARCLHREL